MAVSTRIPVLTIDVFPHGAFMHGEVKPAEDFDKRQAGADDTQPRDKETGQRVREVMVVDADPKARKGQGEVAVKILTDHQPVPPEAIDGLPFRPIEFVGISVSTRNGPRMLTPSEAPQSSSVMPSKSLNAERSAPGTPSTYPDVFLLDANRSRVGLPGGWHDGGMSSQSTTPRKARRQTARLSRDRIAAVTLELIDESGVGTASMRAIASRLGVEAMSLYKYFPTRDILLDAVVDHIVRELDEDPEVHREATAGWRDYLSRLAHGVRRYALAHPHAFPLVTTRPAEAPWINPPLRSLDRIESMLAALGGEGFDDDEVLFAYRSLNSFLLGYLLMESGARTLSDPQEGDGSFAAGTRSDPAPVPGGLSPTRTDTETAQIADAQTPEETLDPQSDIEVGQYPTIHRLAEGLAEDHFEDEFERALAEMLDGIAARLN